ncbi:PAS domain-containing protein [Profundibacter sp.]
MGFVEKRDVYRPSKGTAPFRVEELFFSRTDKRGVIEAANFIFHRVSGYEWEELLGAPHKVIRHPDMPKAVFWLLWESLNNGQSIGAYVKNKAKDGLHYWVYAVVIPFSDGFLSVRIKPTSKILGIIEKEYAAVRKAEVEDGLTPEESATILIQRIKALGYENYASFASDALLQELAARDVAMGKSPEKTAKKFKEMVDAADDVQRLTESLSVGFDSISTVPTNMRIIAARLEPSGGAISSLAQNYWEMSEQMTLWFQDNLGGETNDFALIRSTLISSQFLCGAARLLNETANNFSKERRSLGEVDATAEKNEMCEIAKVYINKARVELQEVANQADKILRATALMHRFSLGLSSTRVMCNIESARLPSGGGSLVDVIKQLEDFQVKMHGELKQIMEHNRFILEHTQAMATTDDG